MFFILSKLLDVALDPLFWAVLGIMLGALFAARKPRFARASVAFALVVLLIFSLSPVVDRLWGALEGSAPNTYRESVTYDVVVLLGGVVDTSGSTATEVAYGNNVERLLTVFDLLRGGKAKQVIISGGPLHEGLPTEALFLKNQLLAWGIEAERIELDVHSKNTHENALQTAALLTNRPGASVLVVTSAFHMQRAAGCFDAVGLKVDTLPVDYRMRRPGTDASLLPRSEYLAESSRALRELSGRLVYRVLGYSK